MKFNFNFSPRLIGQLVRIGIIWFWLGFVILGFIQPEYQPLRDTISVLAVGQYGWIQQGNFIILALTWFVFGLGLSKAFYQRSLSLISSLFTVISLAVLNLIIFPTDLRDSNQVALKSFHSTQGMLHILVVFSMGLIMIGLATVVYTEVSKRSAWKSLKNLTFWLISLGTMISLFWMYCRYTGIFFAWKGLFQKIIISDVLLWMWLMADKLAQFPKLHKAD